MWNRVSNTKSLLAIASSLLIITNALGVKIDNKLALDIVNALLLVLVTLGIINNTGMDTPKWNK
jgi:uncharacterized membrane protein